MFTVVEYSPSGCVHPLNDEVVQNHLLLGSLDNVLLHTVLRHKTINIYLRGGEGGNESSTPYTHNRRFLGNLGASKRSVEVY